MLKAEKLETQIGVKVAEPPVVDQFTHRLLSVDRNWVLTHWSETLSDTIQLIENYLAVLFSQDFSK